MVEVRPKSKIQYLTSSATLYKYIKAGILSIDCILKVLIIRKKNYSYVRWWIGDGNGTPLQYSCRENPMDGGAWKAAVHGVAVTERLHFYFSLSCTGEGNGNLLQCSCLENPRDGGAWWAAVSGVAQSRTRLKWFSSSSSKVMDVN